MVVALSSRINSGGKIHSWYFPTGLFGGSFFEFIVGGRPVQAGDGV